MTNDTKSTFESVEVKDEVVKRFREKRNEIEKSGVAKRNIGGSGNNDANKPEILVVDESDDVESKANSSSEEVCRIDDQPVASISDLVDKSSDLVGGEQEKTCLDTDIEKSSQLFGGELEMVSEVGGDMEKPVSINFVTESPATD